MGGSATDQRALTEGEAGYLASRLCETWEIINIANGGIDGQSTYGHIKDFDWWFPSLPNLKVKYFLSLLH